MDNYVLVIQNDNYGRSCFKIAELDKEELELCDMYSLCECSCISIAEPRVTINNCGFEYELIFDEEFLLKGEAVPNPVASYLYGYTMHKECLCGNVLLAKKALLEDEFCSTGFNKDEIKILLNMLGHIWEKTTDIDFIVHEPTIRFYEF